MLKNYSNRHPESDRDAFPEIDREIQRQKALAKYRQLKNLKKSELCLDDEIFLENFEAAMQIMWGLRRVEITTSLDSVCVPTKCNKDS
ncbi:MAG TPA: hypothetical protein V6D11_28015 [Waterburya sp.]|jgi:hypothetical protein